MQCLLQFFVTLDALTLVVTWQSIRFFRTLERLMLGFAGAVNVYSSGAWCIRAWLTEVTDSHAVVRSSSPGFAADLFTWPLPTWTHMSFTLAAVTTLELNWTSFTAGHVLDMSWDIFVY